MLRPLLCARHFATPDLNRLLAWAVSIQLDRQWQCHEILRFMQCVCREVLSLRDARMLETDLTKGRFVQQIRDHTAFAVVLTDACKQFPRAIHKMLLELAQADWMDKEVRCDASIPLVHASANGGHLLDVNQWTGLLMSYSGARRHSDLLQSALQSLKPLGCREDPGLAAPTAASCQTLSIRVMSYDDHKLSDAVS